jgi:hypothetical protein
LKKKALAFASAFFFISERFGGYGLKIRALFQFPGTPVPPGI